MEVDSGPMERKGDRGPLAAGEALGRGSGACGLDRSALPPGATEGGFLADTGTVEIASAKRSGRNRDLGWWSRRVKERNKLQTIGQ